MKATEDRVERVLELARKRGATASREAVLRKIRVLPTRSPLPDRAPATATAASFVSDDFAEPAGAHSGREPWLPSPLRVVFRALAFLVFITASIARQSVALLVSSRARTPRARAEWLQRTARGCAWLLGLRIDAPATLPCAGLLVANHLSYLDIIVLATLRPCVFVSKAEVARWPIFGVCARLGGTLFLDRTRRGAVAEISEQMRAPLADGLLLVVFPEGTSSGGTSVLPFKSSLIEPALNIGCPVTAAALSYRLEHGSVADEICYWRDMTLLPHLLNVFSKPRIDAALRCGVARPRRGDRKTVARELHNEVAALYQGSTREFRVSAAEAIEEFVPVARPRLPAAAETQRA